MIVLASMLNNTEALTMGAVVGGIIVVVLILAFVLGARRQQRDSELHYRSPLPPEVDSLPVPPAGPGLLGEQAPGPVVHLNP